MLGHHPKENHRQDNNPVTTTSAQTRPAACCAEVQRYAQTDHEIVVSRDASQQAGLSELSPSNAGEYWPAEAREGPVTDRGSGLMVCAEAAPAEQAPIILIVLLTRPLTD